MKKASDNPMQSAHASPRCSATSKRSGQPCQAPAVRGRHVCRMHGARGVLQRAQLMAGISMGTTLARRSSLGPRLHC